MGLPFSPAGEISLMLLLRRLITSCGGLVPQHEQPLRAGDARGSGPVDDIRVVDTLRRPRRPSLVQAGERIAAQLDLARRDARVRTLRATIVPLTFGVLLAFISIPGLGNHAPLAPNASPWVAAVSTILAALGWSGFLSSLDPTSEVMPPAGAMISMCFSVLGAFATGNAALAGFVSIKAECDALAPMLLMGGTMALVAATFCATGFAHGVGLASWRAHKPGADPAGRSGVRCGLPPLTSRRLVDHVWICSGCAYVGISVSAVYVAIVKLAIGLPSVLPELTTMLICSSTALLWWSTTVRVRVQAFLISGGEPIATAAGITTLLGASDTATIQASIASARARFRAIPFKALDESALAQVTPPGRHPNYWYDQSMSASVGECDAFISHSWWDPPQLKWAALEKWAAGFELEHNRQPTMWIDRACIKQTDVQADLQFLPIYLASCKQLVVLAGPTYLSRMWCIVELFVYDQMWPADSAAAKAGPSALDDGELGLVPQVATTARKVIMLLLPGIRSEQFATFDAAKAKSAVPADYERLLRCVEVGCGSVESFNVRARFLLSSALRIEHGEDKAALAGKPHAATRAVVLARPPTGTAPDGNPTEEPPADEDGHNKLAATSGRHFGSATWLFVRVWALAVALFALVGARAIRPALADCAT